MRKNVFKWLANTNIKKVWWIITVIVLLMSVFDSLTIRVFFKNGPVELSAHTAVWLMETFVYLIGTYILYRTAYKKPGYRFLTFAAIVTLCSSMSKLSPFLKSTPSLLECCLFCIWPGMQIFWCVLSYEVRSLNKRIASPTPKVNFL